jgi:hypothetical protein
MRLWAFALLIALITFMTLTRQDDLQSFRPFIWRQYLPVAW